MRSPLRKKRKPWPYSTSLSVKLRNMIKKLLTILAVLVMGILTYCLWFAPRTAELLARTGLDGDPVAEKLLLVQLKEPILEATLVGRDGIWHRFVLSDQVYGGGVWLIAKLNEDDTFEEVAEGQDLITCKDVYEHDIPASLAYSCVIGTGHDFVVVDRTNPVREFVSRYLGWNP
jgi:hypothetical protein